MSVSAQYAVGVVIALVAVTVAWGLVSPPSDVAMAGGPLSPPSPQHWLGTNQLGQDNLIRVFVAAPGTLSIGVVAGLLTLIIGTLYGFLVVLAPATLGHIMMRACDILSALPSVVVAMLVASYVRPGPVVLALLLAAVSWPFTVRVIVALVRREIRRDSFAFARAFGGGPLYLLRRHVAPRVMPVLIALGVQETRQAIMHAAGLAFLGLTDPSFPTWGGMLAEALPLLDDLSTIWLIAAPITALTCLILLLILLGARLETWAHLSLGGAVDRG